MKYKLVIFDLDGTLLDTLDDLSAAVNHAMQQRGFPLHTRDEYMKMVGHGARNLMSQALPMEHKDDEALIDAALAVFRTYYNAHIDVYTKPFPGIQELIAALHQKGVMLAVASNKFQEGTEHLIKEFFPEIPFVAVLGNRQGFPLKPDPEVVGEVLRKAGIPQDQAVMVGDSDTDMETAANGGIQGIAVNWGYRDMSNWNHVDNVEELHKILFS
ncbi:MAG: HAD family hydrolase [Bacteroidales bacterium]|nr:HAD family hydrolase [Bacteroidales bacterium]MBQ6101309.1 HAD family hydrolase [Bacteroidales bacterium]